MEDFVVSLGGALQCALRYRAARDATRSAVHFGNANQDLFEDVISSLTSKGEGVRRGSIEPIPMSDVNDYDNSDFFGRHRLPKS